jgi:HAD superfamily hydrolase (TIGR01458 family)
MAACARLGRDGLVPHLLSREALREDFADLPKQGRKAVVVADAGDDFTFAALNDAFRVLMAEDGTPFLALAKNRRFMDDDDQPTMDAGAFVTALEYASERNAEVLGKPARGFFDAALETASSKAEQAAMIGDDVEADVAGGMAAGLAGVLVRTGKYRDGDENRIDPPPDRVADDLAEAAAWLLGE